MNMSGQLRVQSALSQVKEPLDAVVIAEIPPPLLELNVGRKSHLIVIILNEISPSYHVPPKFDFGSNYRLRRAS
jgi:hypothetical protein